MNEATLGMAPRARRQVAAWLFACAAMVAAMVVVGGVTRLTHSGLSIVEWKPLVGTIPPLSEADWLALFEKYKLTPEYRIVNTTMTLEGFQHIFWWEYFHRLLGRLIGVVFFLPFAWFAVKRLVSRPLVLRLSGIFVLGGLQGAMGWYMVASGLVNEPRVSPYRLAAHLGLAFAILALILWVAIDLLPAARSAPPARRFGRLALALAGLVFVMVLSGAFVAGAHAGFQFNTWPLMGSRLIPEGLFAMQPWWRNAFEHVPLVQLDHRLLAYVIAGSVVALWWQARRAAAPRVRLAGHALLGAVGLQLVLGISTLLLVVPVWLAALHQAGAIVLFSASVWFAREATAAEG
jgi:cytochrome c oxidase assembly protein subunit 15